jgi:branched-chain amino acid aminotransferase
MAEKIFLNDKIVNSNKTCISSSDSGFLYGAGLFETMRCSNGVVFSLDDHLNRLFASAEVLSIQTGYDKQYIRDAVYQVLESNNLTDARIRLTLTGGPMSAFDEDHKATLLITATQIQPYPPEYYQKGIMVILSPYRQNPADPTTGHKTTSYFPRMLALKAAHQKQAAEALWFTTDNRLAEGCVSNVFLVKNSVLYTPTLKTPVLPGIARKTVCTIAAQNSIELVEKDLSIDAVLAADEIFLTNVIMQVMPVVAVEKHTVSDGKVGVITKRILEAYNRYLKDSCNTK